MPDAKYSLSDKAVPVERLMQLSRSDTLGSQKREPQSSMKLC